jgi:hypothetical protein
VTSALLQVFDGLPPNRHFQYVKQVCTRVPTADSNPYRLDVSGRTSADKNNREMQTGVPRVLPQQIGEICIDHTPGAQAAHVRDFQPDNGTVNISIQRASIEI